MPLWAIIILAVAGVIGLFWVLAKIGAGKVLGVVFEGLGEIVEAIFSAAT